MVDKNNKNLKENRHHGDFMLPFIVYEGVLDHTFPCFPIHYHDEMEITLIEEGTGTYMIDLEPLTVTKGDLIFIEPEILHTGTFSNNERLKWTTFVFDLNILRSGLSDGALLKYIAPIINKEHNFPKFINKNHSSYDNLLLTFNNISKAYIEKEIAYELEIKSLLLKLITQLYRNDYITLKKDLHIDNSQTTNNLKNVLNYIHQNFNNPITIKSLASLCNYSEYYFMRFFKKHIGVSAIQYINSYRLEKATDELNNTDKSIMDISLDVGFESLSYFIKLFKRKYNITPLEFKKKNI